ncbi:cytoskeleton-associated protein 2-like [Tenrec ecaudatus]|uniref:cytoskeleton-associated protein 2-like n=1 Tax=Tenrec ecaudatus TaxID=94439 RepID=UPI003F59381F
MTSEDQFQEGTSILKHKMADKENANKSAWSENNVMMGKNYIPLKPNELSNSTIALDIHNCEDNNQDLSFIPIKDDLQIQHTSFNQTFPLKSNSKENQVPVGKSKQDVKVLKKPVLGLYRGKVVESKINSFRKPLQVKDESSAANKKLSTTLPNATKPPPVNTSSGTVETDKASKVTPSTNPGSTASQNRQLLRPPIRSHQGNTQAKGKQGISRTSANVTVRKGPGSKELTQVKPHLSSVRPSASQDMKRNGVPSRNTACDLVARPASSSKIKLMEKSKPTDQRRHTIVAKTSAHSKPAQPREIAEQRRVPLTECKADRGRVPKGPPSSVVTQAEPEGPNGKPVGSFWKTMAEEDEQRLFTEKVNKTFSECLSLISEGCPKEEILITLNDLIKNIPDATKLVKYWVCLARLEPITSPIENIIAIYEKAILAGAQPIEEMRHAIADILTVKNQEKVHLGESREETWEAKTQDQEVNTEDQGVPPEPGKPKMETKHRKSVGFHGCEKEQEDATTEPASAEKTPGKESQDSCMIKYNVSTTPYLQSVKNKILFDEPNSIFKELKFLTPVRRSRRLQDKLSKLPEMLKDHYPCVSSLEQLTELGSDTDAFVCRPNAALGRMYSEMEATEEKSN